MAIQLPLSIALRVDAQFDNFLVCEKNQLVVEALHDFFVNDYDTSMMIWGEHGCGISHLLQAAQQKKAASNMQYLPLRDLLHYPAESICQGLETLDGLIVDNIEVIAGHQNWEEHFFFLFNRLRESGKKLLMGAHQSPQSLNISLPDLRSRMQWGSVYHVHSLQDDEKKQVLVNRAQAQGMSLSEEVAQYIIQRYSRKMNDLMAALQQLDNASLSSQRLLTIPFVKQTLNV